MREASKPPFELSRFADLRKAGKALASALEPYRGDRGALVLGIVRGGVPAAFEVAIALDLPLDIILMRPLVKSASGHLSRAVRVAGTLVVDDHGAPHNEVERVFIDEALSALANREAACRGARPPRDVAGRIVLLIDNGMRTGQTMSAAVRTVRSLNPARIVAAVPVSPPSAVALVGALTDHLHYVVVSPTLGNVAMAYEHFDVPDEPAIAKMLDRV
jgi:putative phosphoribosyl transferase